MRKKTTIKKYRVTSKLLASAIFNRNKAKYISIYSTSSKAKEEIQKIIANLFDEIEKNVLEDRVVEIWGFAKFGLKVHKRFLTKYIYCEFGHTIKRKLKMNQKEYLKQSVLELMFKLTELKSQKGLSDNSSELDKDIKAVEEDLQKLNEALKMKNTSLNPKYRDDGEDSDEFLDDDFFEDDEEEK